MKVLSTEVLHFDSDAYRVKISQRDYSWKRLAHNIYLKRRKSVSAKTSVVGSALCAYVTAGLSMVGAAYSARTANVEDRKLSLLEQEWARRGGQYLPKRLAKDTLIPVVLTGSLCMLTFQIDLGISEAAAASAQIGIPGDCFNEHLVGAEFTMIEKVLSYAATKANDAVADPVRYSIPSFVIAIRS